jgi:hypothetical protein
MDTRGGRTTSGAARLENGQAFDRPKIKTDGVSNSQATEHLEQTRASRDRAEGEEVRSKGTWYVAFEPKERLPGQRAFIRKTETFRNEQDAKTFAKAKLTDGSNINAGTLNPYQPKRIITSVQILDWLKEPDL